MRNLLSSAFVITTILAVGGCGGDNYDGVYMAPGGAGNHVLAIDGDEATYLYMNKASARISDLTELDVSYSDKKMFLDLKENGARYVFTQSLDERGLDCLDCRYGFPKKFTPTQVTLEMVHESIEENRQLEKAEAMAAEQERKKRLKLAPFEGDWVFQRHAKTDQLHIMSISQNQGVKSWVFNYQNGNKIAQSTHKFNVNGKNIFLDSGESYDLSEDGNTLQCKNCNIPFAWAKANSDKINNISYAKELAGNPQ